MKNIIKFFSVAALGLSLVSCSGFLDEEITTKYGPNHMFADEAALSTGIYGCYSRFAGCGFLSSQLNEFLQTGSGILHWGGTKSSRVGNAEERWTSLLTFTRYSKHPENAHSLRMFSAAAYAANAYLGGLASSPVDEEIKKKYEGEAFFLRASSYFYLVRIFGDVTCVKAPPTSVSEVYKTRTDFWEVYNFILEDYTRAFEQMPTYDEMIQMAGGNASGRVCNYGAKAMRSLVYLTIGSLLAHPDDNFWVNRTPEFKTPDGEPLDAKRAFELALEDAEDVINNGPFELAPSYAQLFRWGGSDKKHPNQYPGDFQLKERIFVIPRTAEGKGNNLSKYSLPDYYNATEHNSNFGRMRPTRWLFQKWCSLNGGAKGASANNKNIYQGCGDARLKVSFAYQSYVGNNGSAVYIYPHNSYIKGQTAGATANYEKLNIYSIKYYDATYNNNVGSADLYIMRLAEVYFIAAEAAANLCSSPSDEFGKKALDYVNVVLTRARKSGNGSGLSVTINYDGTGTAIRPKNLTTADVATKDALLERIFWEKCFELNFECHEYFDTHRCGAKWIVDNICKPKNAFLDQPEQDANWVMYNYGTGDPYGTSAADGSFRYFEDVETVRKGLICAYPNDELVANTELDVNLYDPNKGQNPKEVFWR